tara:strand:- start:347 stop:511 length:165 start_codon:yes stop_codon:yes gene_type:complete
LVVGLSVGWFGGYFASEEEDTAFSYILIKTMFFAGPLAIAVAKPPFYVYLFFVF